MSLITTQLAGLSCRIFQQSSGAPRLCAVLCHGYGAPGDDMVPVGPELVELSAALADVRFIFPAGPIALPGMGDARAWWNMDLERFIADRLVSAEAARAADRTFSASVPEGLPHARRLLRALVDEVCRSTQLPLSRLVLGGFSQGGMLATDVALRLEEAPAGLVVWSGALINEAEWKAKAPVRKGLKVVQSHCREDPILSFERAERLRDLLTQAGLDVTFVAGRGGHTIPPEGFLRAVELLAPARVV